MSMQSTRLVLGNRGSIIPSLLNVLQLVGWATIMLALSGEIGARVGERFGGVWASKVFWIVLIGAGTLAWSFLVGSTKLQWVHTIVIVALLVLSGVMTWLALNPDYYQIERPFVTPLSFGRGMRLMDLVIVMPISWVPLIADYSRLARSERGAFWGSFLGYGIASTWMYVIGLVVSLATGTDDPSANILMMMGNLGLTIPAIFIVFSSTMTSDFPDHILLRMLPFQRPTPHQTGLHDVGNGESSPSSWRSSSISAGSRLSSTPWEAVFVPLFAACLASIS
jgi:purine-cytosine permease-like protein